MGKLSWYVNRLKAMNVREVMWRLDQKRIEKQEASRFGNRKISVGSEIWPEYNGFVFDPDALGINFQNSSFGINTDIHLLKGADYERWPDTFSYKLNYKQRDDLGDARTNWEKNRHFDWALKAKRLFVLANINCHELDINYSLIDGCDGLTKTLKTPSTDAGSMSPSSDEASASSENRLSSATTTSPSGIVADTASIDGKKQEINLSLEAEFAELEREVNDWMEKNPFLHGISWTSAMEFAIRSINWMYALAFLEKTRYVNSLVDGYKTKTIKTPEGSVSNCESEIESELSSSASQSSTDSSAAPIKPSGKKQEKPFVADERIGELCGKLRYGIINITEYLTKHYSRFSSANNHLLVEATAIGLAGCAFGHKPWQELAVRILTEELPKQNYSDGVNKELSLHYQTFGMEAYLLLAHVMQKNNDSRWMQWVSMLQKETEFVAHSTWREKAVCEFGDDDEGKILDLQGGEWHQWDYVLQFASLVTGVRYSNFETEHENIHWLFSEEEIEDIKKIPYFSSLNINCHQSDINLPLIDGCGDCRLGSWVFAEGGNSFLRDKEDRVLIGIDHAELGFGSIAAHGHADALSFQMLVDGEVVFADPGTYIYHCNLPARNDFRRTINHNTLCLINNNDNDNWKRFIDQSKMLGAFMWGERANCRLVDYEIGDDKDVLVAEHDGYKPNVHRRTFHFNKVKHELTIEDSLTNEAVYAVTFMLGQSVVPIQKTDGDIELRSSIAVIVMHVDGAEHIAIEDAELSPEYGVKVPTKAIRVYGHEKTVTTTISIRFK